MYRANLCLRTAIRVLVPIKEDSLRSSKGKPEDQVYEIAKAIDWSRYMSADTTFAIDATVYSDFFRNSLFVTYRVKDAIVDFWKEKAGKRPNVNIEDPDIRVNLHVGNDHVTISLDSSGRLERPIGLL